MPEIDISNAGQIQVKNKTKSGLGNCGDVSRKKNPYINKKSVDILSINFMYLMLQKVDKVNQNITWQIKAENKEKL